MGTIEANNTEGKTMTDLINSAADIIRAYNPALADRWLSDPFRRQDLACAFAAGFAKSDDDDIHPHAAIVFRVALATKGKCF